MKTLKVYDDVHTAVKVAAAKEGRTTTSIASKALREFFGLPDNAEPESDEADEPETQADSKP